MVGVDGCRGPARGRIVFEAKNAYVPKNKAIEELDRGEGAARRRLRRLVVAAEEKLPAAEPQLREVNGDKMVVVFDPEDGARLGSRSPTHWPAPAC